MKLLNVTFFFQSYRTLSRWKKRDAFSFDHVQLSDVSTTSPSESLSECETYNYNFSADDTNIIRHQTSVKTTQADEERVQQNNNLSKYSFANCMESLSASTQIVRCRSENNEEMIHSLSYDIECNSDSTNNNNKLLGNEQTIHYSSHDVESDSDSTESESLGAVTSQMLYSNSLITIDIAVLNFVNIYLANNKTNTCIEADLHFITSVLSKPNRMPKTVFKVFEYVKQQAPPCKVVTHYCCKVCQFYYGTSKEVLCNAIRI